MSYRVNLTHGETIFAGHTLDKGHVAKFVELKYDKKTLNPIANEHVT